MLSVNDMSGLKARVEWPRLNLRTFRTRSLISLVFLSLPGQAFFRLFPGFCLADGLSSLALRQQGLDPDLPSSALAWDVSGANIVYLAAEAVVYFCVALLLDHVPPLHHLWYALPAPPAPWSRRAALTPTYSLVPSAPSTPSGPGSLPPSPRLGPQGACRKMTEYLNGPPFESLSVVLLLSDHMRFLY